MPWWRSGCTFAWHLGVALGHCHVPGPELHSRSEFGYHVLFTCSNTTAPLPISWHQIAQHAYTAESNIGSTTPKDNFLNKKLCSWLPMTMLNQDSITQWPRLCCAPLKSCRWVATDMLRLSGANIRQGKCSFEINFQMLTSLAFQGCPCFMLISRGSAKMMWLCSVLSINNLGTQIEIGAVVEKVMGVPRRWNHSTKVQKQLT